MFISILLVLNGNIFFLLIPVDFVLSLVMKSNPFEVYGEKHSDAEALSIEITGNKSAAFIKQFRFSLVFMLFYSAKIIKSDAY